MKKTFISGFFFDISLHWQFEVLLLLLYSMYLRLSGSTVIKVLCYKSEGRWFDPSWCQWIFHGPGEDSASNRNEYQEHFLGGKGGRCVRLSTLPPSCAVVMKSGNLNFLEPSLPVQVCNGTALPFLR